MIRFAYLYATAWIRGLFYRWPSQARPSGYSTACACSLVSIKDAWGLYCTDGRWEPWCFQRVNGYGCKGWSGLYRVPMSAEEIAYAKAIAKATGESA